jgi:hypothetical protein
MNQALHDLADSIGLDEPGHEMLRWQFGLACASRVQHLLEDPRALACLASLGGFVAGELGAAALDGAAREIAQVANTHGGSNSIDGSGHAAVSATYAVANALAGKALDAAAYSAYAAIYAYGGYALTDASAFEAESEWQVERLRQLAGQD